MINEATQLETYIEVSDDGGQTWTKTEELKVQELPDNVRGKTCYIEAETGQRFRYTTANCLGLDSKGSDVQVTYYCDGKRIGARIWRTCRPRYGIPAYLEGVYTGTDSMRPLVFDQATGVYHEQQVKKKSSHSVRYAEAVTAPRLQSISATELDTKPFYTYIFKYQSSALLDINGIRPMTFDDAEEGEASGGSVQPVERSSRAETGTSRVKKEKRARPSSATAPSSRIIDVDAEDDEQATELARLRAENARLRKRVKQETNQTPGAVIDLSMD